MNAAYRALSDTVLAQPRDGPCVSHSTDSGEGYLTIDAPFDWTSGYFAAKDFEPK